MLYCIYRCCRTSQSTVYGLSAALRPALVFLSEVSLPLLNLKPDKNLGDVQTGTKSSWTTFKGAMKSLGGCIRLVIVNASGRPAQKGTEKEDGPRGVRPKSTRRNFPKFLRLPFQVVWRPGSLAAVFSSIFKRISRLVRLVDAWSAAVAHCRYLLRPIGSLVPRCKRGGPDKRQGQRATYSKLDLSRHPFAT